MNKDLFKYFEATRNLYLEHGFVFQNTAKPCANYNEYFHSCGYEVTKPPFLSVYSNIGAYSLDLLHRYRDKFLFNCPPDKESGAFVELCFNIKQHLHAWIKITNIPEDGSKLTRYLCVPSLFAVDPQDSIDFIHNNSEFLVHPNSTTKVVGFSAHHDK